MLLQNNCINNGVTNGLKKGKKHATSFTCENKTKEKETGGEWSIGANTQNIPYLSIVVTQ